MRVLKKVRRLLLPGDLCPACAGVCSAEASVDVTKHVTEKAEATYHQRSTVLVIPSEVENLWRKWAHRLSEEIRDVSTSLDMTKHGHRAFRFSFSRHRGDRLAVPSVGHAGASGYIATMTLFGWRRPPFVNCARAKYFGRVNRHVSFWRAGYFSWKLFWPFALLSIPASYLGSCCSRPLPS
jgi:hypothetical protein